MLGAKPREIDPLEQFRHPPRLGRGFAGQPERHVLRHRKMRKQREILKHQPDRTGFGRQAGGRVKHRAAVDRDGAGVGAFDPGDHPQGGGLATARWPEQAGHLPRRNVKRDIVDHRGRAKAARQVPHLEAGRDGRGEDGAIEQGLIR